MKIEQIETLLIGNGLVVRITTDSGLTGLGHGATLTSQAEFMHRTRANGRPTAYSIPAKMQYDPAPLNNPDDPGHFHADPGYEVWRPDRAASLSRA